MIAAIGLRKLFGNACIVTCAAVAALGLCAAPVAAAARHSAVYCLRGPENTLEVFAARSQPDGRLKFGVTIWNERQHNIVVYGFANRRDGHWDYADHMGADDRCKLTITLSADGTARIVPDSKADCENRGGYGTEIDTTNFPRNAYEGPVTFELNDLPTFANRAGKC